MATPAQIEANRNNARKSTGPRTPEGKSRTRFNRLEHGLRAEEVVLPGEDPAAFEAERRAWFDDWKPTSHTRAVLVERAAAASWRLRRCVRAEAARLRARAEDAVRDHDRDAADLVDGAVDDLIDDPVRTLRNLRDDPAGLDRLVALCDGLLAVATPDAWRDRDGHHGLFLSLRGQYADADPEDLDGPGEASHRLSASHGRKAGRRDRLDPAEALRLAGEVGAELGGLRAGFAAERSRWPSAADLRARAEAEALCDDSAEGQRAHRYEMAHERSLRAAIKGLIDLEKSGADVTEPKGEPEAPAETPVTPPTPVAPTEANPETPEGSEAPSEADPGSEEGAPATIEATEDDRRGPIGDLGVPDIHVRL